MDNSIKTPGEKTKACKRCKEEILAKAKICKHCKADQRNWFFRHKILTTLFIIIILGILGGSAATVPSNPAQNQNPQGASSSSDSNTTDPSNTVNIPVGNSDVDVATIEPGSNPFLHTSGTKIIDINGNEIFFKGVNVEGWLQWSGVTQGKSLLMSETAILDKLTEMVGAEETKKFRFQVYEAAITERDVADIAKIGFNLIRVPVNHRALDDGIGWNKLDDIIAWGEKYKIYILIDLHSPPGGGNQVFVADPDPVYLYQSEEKKKQTIEIWKQMAERYKNKKYVAGYDLINEPVTPNGQDVVDLYDRITAEIRKIDPYHMIVLEGNNLANDFSQFDKPKDSNTAFSFHTYHLVFDNRAKEIAEHVETRHKLNVPMFNSEFAQESYTRTAESKNMLEKDDFPWVFWNWKKFENSAFPQIADIPYPPLWQKTIGWIWWPRWPSTEPTREEALLGMQEYIEALENYTINYETVRALGL